MNAVLFAALTFSLSAQAGGTVFRKDSALPMALQAKVLKAVQENCLSSLYNLTEETTVSRIEQVDQDHETHYRTFLNASYIFDGAHPVGVDIVVESAEFAISNPGVEHIGVLSVKAFSEGICR